MKLSVIVPMLNEESVIESTIRSIRAGAPNAELVIVDGGSIDRSVEITRPLCDVFIESPRGRAKQMNAGAASASGDVFAFVHADTSVPPSFEDDISAALADARAVGGHFRVRLDDPNPIFVLIGYLISFRSRLTRIATGDQAIFVRRRLFDAVCGFSDIPLCEDLDFARRLKRAGRIVSAHSRVITSARRWRRGGIARTIVRMWTIRALYYAGVPPSRLAEYYANVR